MKWQVSYILNGLIVGVISVLLFTPVSQKIYADVGPIRAGATQYIDLKTDGSTFTVAYADRYAFAGGDFRKSELLQSKQQLQNANLAIIDVFRHVFTLRQLRVDGDIKQTAVFDDEVYFGGSFRNIDAQKRMFAAVLDAKTLEVLPYIIDANAVVRVLAPFKKQLVVGGAFTKINNEVFNGLALYDTELHLFVPWRPRLNGAVTSGIVHNALLIVGGQFTQAEGYPRNHVAVYDLSKQRLTTVLANSNSIPTGFIESGSGVMIVSRSPSTPVLIPNKDLLNIQLVQTGVGTTVQSINSSASLSIGQTFDPLSGKIMIDSNGLGFQVPTLSNIMTFAIRAFFAIAGLTALFYMLWGGLNWVMSGGDKDAITAARERIQSAVVGLILMVVVLSVIWTLEQVVFKRRICLGLTCSVTLPGLLQAE